MANSSKKCIKCLTFNQLVIWQLMRNLPKNKLDCFHPYYYTGTEYGEPIRQKIIKCWFVCVSTKAVHQGTADGNSVWFDDGFIYWHFDFLHIRAERRNFVGATSITDDLGRFLVENGDALKDNVNCDGITRHFVLAYRPHFWRQMYQPSTTQDVY